MSSLREAAEKGTQRNRVMRSLSVTAEKALCWLGFNRSERKNKLSQ